MPLLPRPSDDEGKSAFSDLGNLFNWVAGLITEQAKSSASDESKQNSSLKRARALSSRGHTKELMESARAIVKNLELFREQLMQDFGKAAHAFINKSIDPMILNANRLIEEFSQKGEAGEQFSDILEQAVQSVELYSQFSDEKRLKQKIITEAIHSTKVAIEKDFQVLSHYQHHALQEVEGDKEKLKAILDAKLEPIFSELREIQFGEISTTDLRELFIWKQQVDEKRNALNELGFLTIDSTLERKGDIEELDTEDLSGWGELSAMESNIISKSKELTMLAALEERALKLFELLDDTTLFNKDIFCEIENLLLDLKSEAESFQDSREDDSGDDDILLQDTFQGLYESILRAESLLETRKKDALNSKNNHNHKH